MTNNNEIKFLLSKSDWLSTKPTGEKAEEHSRRNSEQLNQYLLSAMQMQNLMVLSGCGTSSGRTKGPSMTELWVNCTKKDNKYTETARNVFKLVSYDSSDENKVNIEELLSLCEAALMIKKDEIIEKFVEDCKSNILKSCSFKKTDDSLSAHKTFIHRLSRRRVRDSRLKIFTTNYDTCFEEAAGSQGIVVIDGFSFAKPRKYDPRFFDVDIVKRTTNSQISDNYLEGVFQLFKLHGSVMWEKDEEGIIEKEATAKGACMIFPVKGKYQQSYIQPHLELMARYLAALREANTCLLIVGFGFNDMHLSEPIMAAIKSNPYLKVIIVDPEAEAKTNGQSNYWKLLKALNQKGEDVVFVATNFEDFADIVPDLKTLTPAEKVANAIKSLSGDK